MLYVFNHTKGDAQEHLYLWYTQSNKNKDPFTSYQDMFNTLDLIYKDQHLVQNSQNQYHKLKIGYRQSF